jgi:hypothetical protein
LNRLVARDERSGDNVIVDGYAEDVGAGGVDDRLLGPEFRAGCRVDGVERSRAL